ncbi:MAG TPA: MSMEG_0568 family radical SAM protein [Jiangellaceae bacterium]|nr:MSMEG_0568 family radical SAM protein [Jiangellaceae bacterium]
MAGRSKPELGGLIAELQSRGARVERDIGGRRAGAGPADAGMIWIDGIRVTFPFTADYVSDSPFVLRESPDGWVVFREDEPVARAEVPPRPGFYDLETEDGVPYWKIALLHIDSLASTVVQTCKHWGTSDQCRFCGIELSLASGATVPVKQPSQLAEVARAAQRLDGAVDVTLTTGTTNGPDKGALYLGRCAQAIKDATGLPVQAQFEPPDDLSVLERIRDQGVDSVGIHIESFDPEVLAWVAPPKARTGVEGYFRAWERAADVFGPGQVSTYVILGMGEDERATVEGCKRAVDAGVYPFVVPLRPIPGSLMGDWLPPDPDYVESLYRQIGPYVTSRGLGSWNVTAGCARCQACSAIASFEGMAGDEVTERHSLPIVSVN